MNSLEWEYTPAYFSIERWLFDFVSSSTSSSDKNPWRPGRGRDTSSAVSEAQSPML
jgi:hypothetical protein